MGVAMLAKAAQTQESIADIANRWVEPVDIKEPNTENARWYKERFSAYRQLYPVLKQIPI